MKKVSQVIVSLVLLMSMMAISCKKNQNAPDPLPDKLVGLTGGVGAIQYDDQNRRTYLLGLTTGYYSTTYKYDSEGKVSDIQLFDGYGGGINHWYDNAAINSYFSG